MIKYRIILFLINIAGILVLVGLELWECIKICFQQKLLDGWKIMGYGLLILLLFILYFIRKRKYPVPGIEYQ